MYVIPDIKLHKCLSEYLIMYVYLRAILFSNIRLGSKLNNNIMKIARNISVFLESFYILAYKMKFLCNLFTYCSARNLSYNVWRIKIK